MTPEDFNKQSRDQLDDTIEEKFMNNLQWSMLFFMFNKMCLDYNRNSEKEYDLSKEFFKGWKKFAAQSIIKKDLETINNVLNSPRNIFNSLLLNKNDTIESTEIYQEKYNKILKNVENFYIKGINQQEGRDND
jgi:hypothetical protein